VDVDETTVAEVVVAPDPVEQLFAAQHLVGVGGQLAQEPELGARAVHLLAVDVPQQPLVGEHFEVPEREHGRLVLGGARPEQQRPDARTELLCHEGLGDVVVGTGLEAGHDVMGVGAGGDDDDGHRTVAAQRPAALEPVHARQHEVDQRDVGGLGGEAVERVLPAGRLVDLIALTFEGQAHRGANPLVVLDHQDSAAHGSPVPADPGSAPGTLGPLSSSRSALARYCHRSSQPPAHRWAWSGCSSSASEGSR